MIIKSFITLGRLNERAGRMMWDKHLAVYNVYSGGTETIQRTRQFADCSQLLPKFCIISHYSKMIYQLDLVIKVTIYKLYFHIKWQQNFDVEIPRIPTFKSENKQTEKENLIIIVAFKLK